MKQLMALIGHTGDDGDAEAYAIKGAEAALSDYIRKLEQGYEVAALRARSLAVYRIMGEDAPPATKNDTYKMARTVLGDDAIDQMMAELAGVERVDG